LLGLGSWASLLLGVGAFELGVPIAEFISSSASSSSKMASSHSVATHVLAAGLASVITVSFMRYRARESQCSDTGTPGTPQSSLAVADEKELAAWLAPLYNDPSLEDVDSAYPEWHDDGWRAAHGWRGNDFIHSRKSKGPRILRYFHDRTQKMLVGAAVFGSDSESHAGFVHHSLGMSSNTTVVLRAPSDFVGSDDMVISNEICNKISKLLSGWIEIYLFRYCHGGTMTALLDDVLGHAAFICGDGAPGPWSGATVSVNCSLKKPVAVGSVLKVGGTCYTITAMFRYQAASLATYV